MDVEEYFQVAALESVVPRTDWGALPSRVEESVRALCEMLERHGASGTFFVLGCVADRHPALVRALVRGGHEVASHGMDHRRVTELTPEEFRASVRESKDRLEQIAGVKVLGFRAPSFSIVPGREWALDILIEEGYRYDSSLFPVRRPGYGYPAGLRDVHRISRPSGTLLEIPPTTVALAGINLPAAGGAYLRLFPYALVRSGFRQAERRQRPGTFYIHPWELDPQQPRLQASWANRLRHYGGLDRVRGRLERLLAEFHFTSIARQLECGVFAEVEATFAGAGR